MKTSTYYSKQAGGIIWTISFLLILGGRRKMCRRHFSCRAELALFVYDLIMDGTGIYDDRLKSIIS